MAFDSESGEALQISDFGRHILTNANHYDGVAKQEDKKFGS